MVSRISAPPTVHHDLGIWIRQNAKAKSAEGPQYFYIGDSEVGPVVGYKQTYLNMRYSTWSHTFLAVWNRLFQAVNYSSFKVFWFKIRYVLYLHHTQDSSHEWRFGLGFWPQKSISKELNCLQDCRFTCRLPLQVLKSFDQVETEAPRKLSSQSLSLSVELRIQEFGNDPEAWKYIWGVSEK